MMKKIFLIAAICGLSSLSAQDHKKDFVNFLAEQNKQFMDVEETPLSPADRDVFKELDYFAFSGDWVLPAKWMKSRPFVYVTTWR